MMKKEIGKIDKGKNRENLEKLRVKYLGREKGFSRQ